MTASPAPYEDHLRGLLITVFAVCVLSPDALIVRLVETDRWTLLWWRGLLMATGLALYLVLRHRRHALTHALAVGRLGILSALLFAGSTVLFVTSVTMTSVANTLVIVNAAPLFAAVFSQIFLGERVPVRTWIAVTVGMAGILMIFAGSLGSATGSLWGDLCATGTAGFLAGHLVVARRARPVSMVPAVALSGLVVAAFMAPFASPLAVTSRDLVLLLLLGLVIMPIAFGLITEGPRHLPAPEVSLILLLETALGPLWVWIALDEVPARETFMGGAVVVATLVVHSALALRKRDGPRGAGGK